MRNGGFSFAPPHNLIRLFRDPFVECVVAHHHRRGAAAREAFDELDRELPVLSRLRAVRLRVEAKFLAKMPVQLVEPPSAQLSVRQILK